MIPNSFQDTTSITGVVCQKRWGDNHLRTGRESWPISVLNLKFSVLMLILLFLPSFPASHHPFVAGQALSVCDSVGHPWSESDAVFPTLQWLHTCRQTAWRQRPHTLVSADACNIDFLRDSFLFIGSWMWVPDIFQSLNRAQPLPVPSLQDYCRQKFVHYIRRTSLRNKLIIVSPDWEENDKHAVPNFGCETSRKAAASILRSDRIISSWILVEEVVSVRDGWR